jgi:YD repeat-containing protein
MSMFSLGRKAAFSWGKFSKSKKETRRRRVLEECSRPIIEALETRILFGHGTNGPVKPPSQCPPQPAPTTQPSPPDVGSGPSNQGQPADSDIQSGEPVDYLTGTSQVSTTDLESDAFGEPFGVTRVWTGQDDASSLGNGWANSSMPYLSLTLNQLPEGDVYAVVTLNYSGDSQVTFRATTIPDQYGNQTFFTLFSSQDSLTYVPSGLPGDIDGGRFIVTDSSGDTMVFNDLPREINEYPVDGAGDLGDEENAESDLNEFNSPYNPDMETNPPSQAQDTGDGIPFGALMSYTDSFGDVTNVTYSDGQLATVEQSTPSGDVDRFVYTYGYVANTYTTSTFSGMTAPGVPMVSQVALEDWSSTADAWSSPIRWVDYSYYNGTDSDDAYGRLGDLKTATIMDDSADGSPEVVREDYYRYDEFFTPAPGSSEFDGGDPFTGPNYNNYQTDNSNVSITGGASLIDAISNDYESDPSGGEGFFNPSTDGGVNDEDEPVPPLVSSGLSVVVQGASFTRLAQAAGGDTPTETLANIEAMPTSEIQPYADYTFDYQPYAYSSIQSNSYGIGYRVISETVSATGCGCSGVNGAGTFNYSYSTSDHPLDTTDFLNSYFDGDPYDNEATDLLDMNTWVEKITETLPSGGQDIVYTNGLGETMLSVALTGGVSSATYYRYDWQGRITLMAEPSAVANYTLSDAASEFEGNSDLVGYDATTGTFANLSADNGAIYQYNYDPMNETSVATATSTVPGNVPGYLECETIQQGFTGTPSLVTSQNYFTRTLDDVTAVVVASQSEYPNADGLDPNTTSYSYGWYSTSSNEPTLAIESITTTLPVVSTADNGSGSATTSEVIYDHFGRPIWSLDPNGAVDYTAYDPMTGGITETIQDVGDPSSVSGAPAPGPSRGSGLPAALNLTTTYVLDSRGRATEETDPDGNVTYFAYGRC